MSISYRIGEVAEMTGISVEALRYYEKRGLLKTPPRTDGGFRRYASDVVEQINFIRQAQALGLTLDDIQRLLLGTPQRKGPDCRRVRDLLTRHIVAIDERLKALNQLRQTLSKHVDACEAALRKGADSTCPTLAALDSSRPRRNGAGLRS